MKSPAIALLFHGQGAKTPPETPADSPADEAGETAQDASAEAGGMSDVEAQHHAKVFLHHGKAIAAFARGKSKEAKVHVKLAMHHHGAAMKEAGLNDEEQHASGGTPEMTPGQPAGSTEYGNE